MATFTFTGTLLQHDGVTPYVDSSITIYAGQTPDLVGLKVYSGGGECVTDANGVFSISLVTGTSLYYAVSSDAKPPVFQPFVFAAGAASSTVNLASVISSSAGAVVPSVLTDAIAARDLAQSYATAAAASAASIPASWQASTVYSAGAVRVAPDGTTITRIASGTSRATYDATEQALWTVQLVTPGTQAQGALDPLYNGGQRSPSQAIIPPRPQGTMLTTFQSGHGFSVGGAGGTSNVNDTSDTTVGSQCVTITTGGTGGNKSLFKTAFTATDLTGKQIALWLKVDDVTHLSQIDVKYGTFSGSNWWTVYPQQTKLGSDQDLLKSGEMVRVVLTHNDSAKTGTPTRNNVTFFQIDLLDDAGGAVTAHFYGIEAVPVNPRFPNGVVTFSFDDGYVAHSTVAAPYLAKYGWVGDLFPVVSNIGSGANFLTLAQVQALQDSYGWNVGAHAYTLSNHNAGMPNLTQGQRLADFRLNRQWLNDNGLRGADHYAYPLGQFDTSTLADVKRHYATARTTNVTRKGAEAVPPSQPARIGCKQVDAASTSSGIATITALIDDAYTGGNWLNLLFHDLVVSGASGTSCTIANFQAIVDYCATKGVAVMSTPQVLRADAGAVPVVTYTPPAAALTDPTGTLAVTFDRRSLATGSSAVLTSGTGIMAAIEVKRAITATNINFRSGGAGASSPTHQWAAIKNTSGTVLAVTADATTTALGANAVFTWPLTAPTTLAAGLYYVELMFTATTGPQIQSSSTTATPVASIAPILCGNDPTTGRTTPPTVGAADTVPSSANGIMPYVWLT